MTETSNYIFIPGVEIYREKKRIWEKGNVPAQKNSMVMTKRGIFPSKNCKEFIKQSSVYFHRYYDKWKKMTERIPEGAPIHVWFMFARTNKRTFDLHNGVQVLADCMSGHHFLKQTKTGLYSNVYSGVRNPKFNPKQVKWRPEPFYTGEDIPFDPERYKWLKDDDYKNFVPHFGKVFIDKAKPGVYMHVFNYKPNHKYDY